MLLRTARMCIVNLFSLLVCNKLKCGDQGCLKGYTSGELCCNEECLGGCFQLNSPHHCYACRHLRQMSNGECVKKCQGHLFEVKAFIIKCSQINQIVKTPIG